MFWKEVSGHSDFTMLLESAFSVANGNPNCSVRQKSHLLWALFVQIFLSPRQFSHFLIAPCVMDIHQARRHQGKTSPVLYNVVLQSCLIPNPWLNGCCKLRMNKPMMLYNTLITYFKWVTTQTMI